MPRPIRWLAILSLLAGMSAHAADLPGPWVELTADGGLDIRAVTAPNMSCPQVSADGAALPTKARGQPDPADGAYPVQVCVAHAASSARSLTVDGLPVPILPTAIRRIVVIGDTGCQLKGNLIQDCNDPRATPTL
jgi:hypothetical protein